MTVERSTHVDIMDGMRGIAIALVMWFHVWEITWQGASFRVFGRTIDLTAFARMGFVGVDVFFFVSGFCLFWPYARALAAKRALPTVRHFAYRRFIKIVPSYVLAIAVLVALGSERGRGAADGIKDVLAHVFFVHPWFQSYLGSIDGVLWSLGVEVQFYVLFPAIAWAFVRRPASAALIMSGAALGWRYATEQCCAAGATDHFHQLALQLPAYLDLFAAGMFAAWFAGVVLPPITAKRRTTIGATALALAGFGWLAALIVNVDSVRSMHDYAEHWQVWHRLPFAFALLFATAGSVAAFPAWHRFLANPLLVFLSLISYNAYIWHQLIARSLLYVHFPRYATADPHDDPAWQLVATPIYLLAGVAVASVLTFGFERPLLRLRFGEGRPRRPAASSEA